MLIGLGGGAASSMAAARTPRIWISHSVQRGNAGNPAPRAGSDRSLLGAGRAQSDPLDPRRRRGRACPTRCPKLAHTRRRGARIDLRSDAERRAGHVADARSGATRRRSATCSRSRRTRWSDSQRICERERCPFAVVGEVRRTTAGSSSRIRCSATRPVDMPLEVLLGKPPRMLRDVRTCERALPRIRR